MAQLRKPIEREPAAGLLGRVTRPVAKPVAAPPVAPPPAVAAPAVAAPANIPSMTDYIAKRLAEAPEYIEDELGNTVFDYSRGDAKFAQEWADTYRPDLRQQGFLINSPWGVEENFGGVTKDRSDIGERWTQFATLNPDGTIGEVRDPQYQKKSAGIKGFIKPVLAVASVIPSPFQPFAQMANAALAASEGKPLNAALSLYGAANSTGFLDGISAPPTGGVDNYDLQGNFDLNPSYVPPNSVAAPGGLDSVSGYNPNGFGGLPKPIIGSELAGGASMIPGIDTNAFTGGLNTVAAGSGLTSLGGPPDMTPVGKPGLLEVPALPEVAPPQSLLEAPPPIVEPTIPKPVSNDPFKDVSGYNPDGFGGTPKPIIASEAPGLSQIPGMNPDAFAPGYGGLLPGNGVTSPGAPMDQNLYQQAVAKGKELLAAGKDNEFYQWMTDPANALYVKAAMAGGGALLSSVGSSSSGGSSYKDDGYRPTISRGGFQASIPATGAAPGGPGMAPGGFGSGISLPTTGQANDGLWRYAGNRPASLISPPYTAPPTGLISPPAVANYNPRPTGPLPTNVPPMQYGYDDPVGNRQNLTPAQQRLLQNATGLLGTPAPRGFF